MPNLPRKPDPLQLMATFQAQKMLDAPGPTSFAKMFGASGHIRLLKKQLLDNERAFRIAIAKWYRVLGRDVAKALRASTGYTYLQDVQDAVAVHREYLRAIVHRHVQTSALLSAALQWQVHQVRSSAKGVMAYIQKGVWSIVRSLPQKLLTAVKLTIAGIMAVFSPEAIIEPIIAKVEKAIVDTIGDDPNNKHKPAKIAGDVEDKVFTHKATESIAAAVAVTTNTSAANAGTAAAGGVLAQTGIVNAKVWRTLGGSGAIDDKVRRSHRKANGQIVGLDADYVLDLPGKAGGTETCSFPGDPALSPGNLRHCRCLSVYIWVALRGAA